MHMAGGWGGQALGDMGADGWGHGAGSTYWGTAQLRDTAGKWLWGAGNGEGWLWGAGKGENGGWQWDTG